TSRVRSAFSTRDSNSSRRILTRLSQVPLLRAVEHPISVAEIAKIDRELTKLLTAIKSGGPIEAIVEDMKQLEARKVELKH
ncbi:hypothetical protein F9L04_26410, partial [Brucella anthropi]